MSGLRPLSLISEVPVSGSVRYLSSRISTLGDAFRWYGLTDPLYSQRSDPNSVRPRRSDPEKSTPTRIRKTVHPTLQQLKNRHRICRMFPENCNYFCYSAVLRWQARSAAWWLSEICRRFHHLIHTTHRFPVGF
jgi:hypothetical protein